jgi:hypothetical protein
VYKQRNAFKVTRAINLIHDDFQALNKVLSKAFVQSFAHLVVRRPSKNLILGWLLLLSVRREKNNNNEEFSSSQNGRVARS